MAKSVTHADKADLFLLLELSSKFYIVRLIFSHYCYFKNVSAYGDDETNGFLARKRGGGLKAIASGGNEGGPLARKGKKERDGGSADAKKIMGKDFFPTRGAMFFSSSRPPFSQPPSRIKGRRTKDPFKNPPVPRHRPLPFSPSPDGNRFPARKVTADSSLLPYSFYIPRPPSFWAIRIPYYPSYRPSSIAM